MDRQAREADDKFRMLSLQLKEKEQENRISKLKIKELRRQLKHNHLQPLQSSVERSAVTLNAAPATTIGLKPPLTKQRYAGAGKAGTTEAAAVV